MGLDMHLYAISRITAEEAEKYNGKPIDDIYDDGISVINVDKSDKEDMEMIRGIMPYLTKVTAVGSFLNVDKVRTENSIPDDAYISGESFSSEYTEYMFRNDKGFHKSVQIENSKLYSDYALHPMIEVYLFHKREIHYWRKYYELQSYIYDMLEEENGVYVMNCGYYPLTDGQIEEINEYLKDHPYGNGRVDEIPERNTEDEAIVYWEWY